MESDLIRGIMFFTGVGVSAHHLAAAAALKRAPHIVKGFALPLTVSSGVVMAVMAITGNTTTGLYCALGMVVGMGITEVMVWRAGAYISAELDRQAEVHEMSRRKVNHLRSAMLADWEMLEALRDDEKEQHEKARSRD
jgi:hypothetical protein